MCVCVCGNAIKKKMGGMPHICKQGFSFCVITVFFFSSSRFFLCMCSNLLFNGFLWGYSDKKKRPSFQAAIDARKEYFLCFIGNKALGLAVSLLKRSIPHFHSTLGCTL